MQHRTTPEHITKPLTTTNTPDPIILRLAEIVDANITRAELARALNVPSGRVTVLLGSKAKPATMSPSEATVQRVLDAVNAKTGKHYTLKIILE
jgi:hypothetical protein